MTALVNTLPKWAMFPNARKAHAFDQTGTALCGKWMFFGKPTGEQDTGDLPGPDDCKACHRKMRALIAKETP